MNLTKTLLISSGALVLMGASCGGDNNLKPETKSCTTVELYSGGAILRRIENVTSFDDFNGNYVLIRDSAGNKYKLPKRTSNYLVIESPCK